MKIVVLVSRILLGLLFTVIGLNHVVPFMHMAAPPGDASALLGLTLLAGMGINILLFHLTLEPSGLVSMLAFGLMELVLVYAYRASFAGIFAARARPAV